MTQIVRKDGISYVRREMRGKETIPDKTLYKQTVSRLATEGLWDCLLAVRMGCEMGLARIDIVNAEVKNINRNHTRSLWIEISKMVKRGGSKEKPIYKMRSRDIPVNPGLYSVLMNYIDKDTKYVLKRKKGEITKPFDVQRINELYEEGKIPWSPHKSRHYFRTELNAWLRTNRMMDSELVDSLMGHRPKGASEMYGVISWEYKQEVVDKVFS
jgi:integrase